MTPGLHKTSGAGRKDKIKWTDQEVGLLLKLIAVRTLTHGLLGALPHRAKTEEQKILDEQEKKLEHEKTTAQAKIDAATTTETKEQAEKQLKSINDNLSGIKKQISYDTEMTRDAVESWTFITNGLGKAGVHITQAETKYKNVKKEFNKSCTKVHQGLIGTLDSCAVVTANQEFKAKGTPVEPRALAKRVHELKDIFKKEIVLLSGTAGVSRISIPTDYQTKYPETFNQLSILESGIVVGPENIPYATLHDALNHIIMSYHTYMENPIHKKGVEKSTSSVKKPEEKKHEKTSKRSCDTATEAYETVLEEQSETLKKVKNAAETLTKQVETAVLSRTIETAHASVADVMSRWGHAMDVDVVVSKLAHEGVTTPQDLIGVDVDMLMSCGVKPVQAKAIVLYVSKFQ